MKRYDVWIQWIQYGDGDSPYVDFGLDDRGQWCHWEDVEKLIAERDELRELLDKTTAALSRHPMIDPEAVTPWDKRAAELQATEGSYCHFAAWREWFNEWNARLPWPLELELDLDGVDGVLLYSAFCEACNPRRSDGG